MTSYYPSMSVEVADAPVFPDFEITLKTVIKRRLVEADPDVASKIVTKLQELMGDLVKEAGYDAG